MNNRKEIRNEVRKLLQSKLNIKRFSARTSPLESADFPAALIYFPSEQVLDDKDVYTERELELRVEVGIIPSLDPEDEIYGLSDELEAILLGSSLSKVLRKIDLVSVHFVVEGDGVDVVAAAQHVYRINYLVPRTGAMISLNAVA
jgi:hypothetical protein